MRTLLVFVAICSCSPLVAQEPIPKIAEPIPKIEGPTKARVGDIISPRMFRGILSPVCRTWMRMWQHAALNHGI